MITDEERKQAAKALLEAERKRKPITQVSRTWTAMELEDAYAVQQLWADERIKAGARPIGHKIGLTSRAILHPADFRRGGGYGRRRLRPARVDRCILLVTGRPMELPANRFKSALLSSQQQIGLW